MFVKTIVMTDKKTGKQYDYYRLCESYRINDKVRHRSIISFGKLENIDNLKDNMLKEIKKENRELLEDEIKKISKKTASDIEDDLITKIKDLENKTAYIKSQENKLDKQTETTNEINNKIKYLLNHNNFLMMKLVNKAILSDREVNEMHMRATKESKK